MESFYFVAEIFIQYLVYFTEVLNLITYLAY